MKILVMYKPVIFLVVLLLGTNSADKGNSAVASIPPTGKRTLIKAGENLLTQVELIRITTPSDQRAILQQLKTAARQLSHQPGFISVNLHRSIDGKLLVNFIQWENQATLEQARKASGFDQVITHHAARIKERHNEPFQVVSSHSTEGDFTPIESWTDQRVTLLDLVAYTADTQQEREEMLQFNLSNGSKFVSQAGYLATSVLKNTDVSRGFTYSNWASVADFLNAVKATAPPPLQAALKAVNTVDELNVVLQRFGKSLGNLPEYHVYEVALVLHR